MSDRPWYRRYGSDFISGTLGLTLEEKGAYSLILDLIYDRGQPIPDDARYIAGVCGCSLRKWSAIRDRLVSLGKIEIVDGFISNKRARNEIERSAKIAEKFAENGSKGGRIRAENEARAKENNEIAQAGLKHRALKPEPEPEERIEDANASPSSQRASAPAELGRDPMFEAFYDAFPRKVGLEDAEEAWTQAVERGADPRHLLEAARDYARKRRGEPERYTTSPAKWLRDRRWAEFVPSAAPPDASPRVLVASDDPRYPALADRYRAEKRKLPPCGNGGGWYFPEAWVAALETAGAA